MAQPATTPKLEELRLKLKADPKSRLFYQLAEELRKAGHFDESEQVLRSGLIVYPTYLAAWVSLGRTLREQKNESGAVDALNKALQLDPGNVVAARIMADAYLAMGERVEAIKKYKLVHALLPSDEELVATIESLERDIHGSPAEQPAEEPALAPAPAIMAAAAPAAEPETVEAPLPAFAPPPPEPQPSMPSFDLAPEAAPRVPFEEDSPFDRTMPPFAEAPAPEANVASGQTEDQFGSSPETSSSFDDSPFADPPAAVSESVFETSEPAAEPDSFDDEDTPVAASMAQDDGRSAESHLSDAADTVTMADLYARQGLVEEARNIYEHILARDEGNAEVRAKLEALAPQLTPQEASPRVASLERWLGKVGKREVGRV